MTDSGNYSMFQTNDPLGDENETIIKSGEKGLNYRGGFFILIAMGIGGMMVASFIAITIWAATGNAVTDMQEGMLNPANRNMVQLLQVITSVVAFLGATLFTAFILNKYPLRLTGFLKKISARQVLLTIVIMGCGLALSSALGYASYQIPFPKNLQTQFARLETEYFKQVQAMISLNSIPDLIISLFVLALLPAICEEVFFRGGLQNYLYRSTGKMWMSIIIVSIIFSLVHFSAYGFLARLALGIILGLLYQYSGSIWPGIIAHFLNNAGAVISMYVMKSSGKNMNEMLNDTSGSYMGLLVIPALFILFRQFQKTATTKTLMNGI